MHSQKTTERDKIAFSLKLMILHLLATFKKNMSKKYKSRAKKVKQKCSFSNNSKKNMPQKSRYHNFKIERSDRPRVFFAKKAKN